MFLLREISQADPDGTGDAEAEKRAESGLLLPDGWKARSSTTSCTYHPGLEPAIYIRAAGHAGT